MSSEESNPDKKDIVKEAINSDVQKLYFNGYANSLGPGDVVSTLLSNGNPVAVVNMSYTIAKTYAYSLLELIAHLEKATGNEIMMHRDIDKALSKDISSEDLDA